MIVGRQIWRKKQPVNTLFVAYNIYSIFNHLLAQIDTGRSSFLELISKLPDNIANNLSSINFHHDHSAPEL